jgi:ABC-type taurine transport system ATPase subunit
LSFEHTLRVRIANDAANLDGEQRQALGIDEEFVIERVQLRLDEFTALDDSVKRRQQVDLTE